MFDCYFNEYNDLFSDDTKDYRYLVFESIKYFIYIKPNKTDSHSKFTDLFMHLASVGPGDTDEEAHVTDSLLCVNTRYLGLCYQNCVKKTYMFPNGRCECIFRADLIKNIPLLIKEYNSGSTNVICWKKDEKLYLRSTIKNIDYVAIFSFGRNKYKGLPILYLVTAFPVVSLSFKNKFTKQYIEYSAE